MILILGISGRSLLSGSSSFLLSSSPAHTPPRDDSEFIVMSPIKRMDEEESDMLSAHSEPSLIVSSLSTSGSDFISPESESSVDADFGASIEDCATLNEPVYSGSTLTVGAAVCAIMEFCIRNNLTYKAIDELLKLLQILCVSPNRLPKSVFILKKFFNHFNSTEYSHYEMCSNCKEKCEVCVCNKPSKGVLVHISIDKPLKAIVSRKSLRFNISI